MTFTNEISNRAHPEITKEVENILLDIFSENANDSYPSQELEQLVKNKISDKYKLVDISAHVGWALDMLHANQLIKKVGPGTWESVDGPDPVYAERSTGYAPPGEFAGRGKNFLSSMTPSDRKKFNADLTAAETSIKMLKNAGYSKEDAYDAIMNSSGTRFSPVAIKIAIKKVYSLPGVINRDVKPENDVDMSIFGNDIDIQK